MLLLNQNFTYFLAQLSSSSQDRGGNVGYLFFVLFSYLFGSYCFYRIYQKLGSQNAWFAWIPILNNWIMYKEGEQSPWWVIGLFIPLVNVVALLFLLAAFIKIVQRIGKNPWLILLLIVPLVNFIVMYHFAFG